jgi:hypothetical protein
MPQLTPKFRLGDRVVINANYPGTERHGTTGTVDYVCSDHDGFYLRFDNNTGLTYCFGNEVDAEPVKETTMNQTTATPTQSFNGNDIFNIDATKAVIRLAKTRRSFTTDDVWAAIQGPAGVDPRALGSIMTTAASQGVIKATGRYKPSKRVECHRRPIRIWKSLLTA